MSRAVGKRPLRTMLQTSAWRTILVVNVVCTGVLLGLLQWGVFFMLQSYLASTAMVYLLGTSVWLIGSVIGLAVAGEGGELWWAAGMVVAYYVFRYVALAYPYNLACLPLLLVMIAIMGGYAGRFFRYRSKLFGAPKWLFFIENCGFVIGMVCTIVALFHIGASVLITAPLIGSALVLATAVSLRFHSTP